MRLPPPSPPNEVVTASSSSWDARRSWCSSSLRMCIAEFAARRQRASDVVDAGGPGRLGETALEPHRLPHREQVRGAVVAGHAGDASIMACGVCHGLFFVRRGSRPMGRLRSDQTGRGPNDAMRAAMPGREGGLKRGLRPADIMACGSDERGFIPVRPAEEERLRTASTSGSASKVIPTLHQPIAALEGACVNFREFEENGGSLTPRSHIGQINTSIYAP